MAAHHLETESGTAEVEARRAASYTDLLIAEPALAQRTRDALREAQKAHGLHFNERPLCTVLRPRFLTPSRFEAVAAASRTLAEIFERAGSALLASEKLLYRIHASEQERDLWEIDPGYPEFTLTSRLDTFLIGDTPHVVEYNAESPASIGFCDRLTEIFSRLPATRAWGGSQDLRGFSARRELTATLINTWAKWGGSGKPAIAITDWEDVPTRRDFDLCAEYFREQGLTAIVSDPRAFEYRKGRLWLGNVRVDIIYRRVLLHELLDKAPEAEAILQAYRDGAVCMVNSPRSKLLHKKAVMALLSAGELPIRLTAEEQRTVDETIPWTRQLLEGETTYGGERVDLPRFVLDNKDRLVLKPSDDYGGRGVVLGWEVSSGDWERAVEGAFGQPYVIQERVPVARADFPVWGDDGLAIERLILDTDPLLFSGHCGGILTRMSGSALLNVTAGAGSTAPTFVLEDEE